MTRNAALALALAAFVMTVHAAEGAPASAGRDRWFQTTDGVRLHYVDAGDSDTAVLLVPGWLMPAAIFDAQIQALSTQYRVLALDPRGQGLSDTPPSSKLGPEARARDIKELIETAGVKRFVLLGWSLGVMESLDFLTRFPSTGLAGLVLVDNSIGMVGPPDGGGGGWRVRRSSPQRFRTYMHTFVRSMFAVRPSQELLDALDASTTRLAPASAWGLLRKGYPREYYRSAVLGSGVNVWYAIRPRFEEQGQHLVKAYPRASVTVFDKAGHALFVDEAARFNAELLQFLATTL